MTPNATYCDKVYMNEHGDSYIFIYVFGYTFGFMYGFYCNLYV